MIKQYSQFAIFLLFLSMTSCLSINSLQDGKTLGESNVEIGVNGDFTGLTDLFFDNNASWLLLEGFVRAGVSERLDIGIKANYTGFIAMNTKYQIVGNQSSTFASSIGLEMGINLFSFEETNYYGLLTSYNSFSLFENNLHFIFSPKYAFHSKDDLLDNPQRNILGLSYGILIGDQTRVGIENTHFSVFNGINTPTYVSQYSFCVTYRLNQTSVKEGYRRSRFRLLR